MCHRNAFVPFHSPLVLGRARDHAISARTSTASFQQGQAAQQPEQAAESQPATVLVGPHLEAEIVRDPIESAMRTVIAYMHWRIGMMTERWEPSLPDDAPRRHATGVPGFR